jgi:hypothetical protein
VRHTRPARDHAVEVRVYVPTRDDEWQVKRLELLEPNGCTDKIIQQAVCPDRQAGAWVPGCVGGWLCAIVCACVFLGAFVSSVRAQARVWFAHAHAHRTPHTARPGLGTHGKRRGPRDSIRPPREDNRPHVGFRSEDCGAQTHARVRVCPQSTRTQHAHDCTLAPAHSISPLTMVALAKPSSIVMSMDAVAGVSSGYGAKTCQYDGMVSHIEWGRLSRATHRPRDRPNPEHVCAPRLSWAPRIRKCGRFDCKTARLAHLEEDCALRTIPPQDPAPRFEHRRQTIARCTPAATDGGKPEHCVDGAHRKRTYLDGKHDPAAVVGCGQGQSLGGEERWPTRVC